MILLFALLLAFLAQNLLTPYPVDFLGVCLAICALGALNIARREDQRLNPRWLVALVALLVAVWQLTPPWLAAFILFLLASIIFVWETRAADNDAQSPQPTSRFAAVRILHPTLIALIILASAALCLYDNARIQPGLHGDEAESGLEARNLNTGKYSSLIGVGWYDQPLASFLVQAVGLRIFGDSVSGLRTTSALVSLLTLPLVYLLARQMFDRRVALITLALMAFAHWFIAYARLGINYNQTTLLQTLAVLAFWKGWQSRRWQWFAVSGLATGAGLYLYFASRIVPILLIAFAAYLWAERRSVRLRHIALWAVAILIVFAPMGAFFVEHAREFSSRAAFVFLFSDTQWNTREEKMRIYTGTTEAPLALMVQVQRYTMLFNVGGARDGQYGNTLSLLDYYTAVFFVLGLAFALPRLREARFMLLLLWLALTVFIGGVLTIESPFTPRLVGLMPAPFMLAAVALDRAYRRLQTDASRLTLHASPSTPHASRSINRPLWRVTSHASRLMSHVSHLAPHLPAAILALLFAAIVYFNYWSYFERYIYTIDGWAQREPATAVARYAAQMTPDQTLYVMSAPELFVWHGTIRFLAPQLRGFDLLDPEHELPVRDMLTKRASFVMLPNHVKWLEKLKTLYPNGTLKEFRRPWGELWYVIYEVPEGDVAAHR